MMTTPRQITISIGPDIQNYTDEYLAALWHVTQINPAPYGDPVACDLAETIGREIIRRFLAMTRPELWNHQGRHVYVNQAVERQSAVADPDLERKVREACAVVTES